jgi:hypothetical protein
VISHDIINKRSGYVKKMTQIMQIKLFLYLTKYHAMKTYWGVEVQLHALTSVLYGGEWSASCSDRFTTGTNWIGGWAGPRAVLDAVATRKNPNALSGIETRSSRLWHSHYID